MHYNTSAAASTHLHRLQSIARRTCCGSHYVESYMGLQRDHHFTHSLLTLHSAYLVRSEGLNMRGRHDLWMQRSQTACIRSHHAGLLQQ